ncbi:MAG: hypothetical protein QF642_02450 [Myxococcota bacterium]|nr:hypothetical protein [Myxococcota bacterium]
MQLVEIRARCGQVRGLVLGHEHERVLRELREHAGDLFVREVLEYLANQAEIAFGQRLGDRVQAFELDCRGTEALAVAIDQARHDVQSPVLDPIAHARQQTLADHEVTATEVDHPSARQAEIVDDPRDEPNIGVDVLLVDGPTTGGEIIETLAPQPPLVDVGEDLAR